jgi:hypothetical protein
LPPSQPAVVIHVHHAPGVCIRCVRPDGEAILGQSCNGDQTQLTLRPESLDGPVRLQATYPGKEESKADSFDVVIDMISWALSATGDADRDWIITALQVPRDWLRATSNRFLTLRRTTGRAGGSVRFGPSWDRGRRVLSTGQTDEVPLRDFCDLDEMRFPGRAFELRLWANSQTSVPVVCVSEATPIAAARFRSAIAQARFGEPGVLLVQDQPWLDYFREAPRRDLAFLERLLADPTVAKIVRLHGVSVRLEGSSARTRRQVRAAAHAVARLAMRTFPQDTLGLRRQGYGGCCPRGRSAPA